MPTPITEYFNGGIVTARHPALLNPGELQRADECIYRENDPAIHRAPGRTAYGTLPTVPRGLMSLTFDTTVPDQIIGRSGTTMYTSQFTSLTGTFTEITTSGTLAGTLSGNNTFTAAGYNFTTDIIGMRVSGFEHAGTALANNTVVTAVTGAPVGAYYPAVTISPAIAPAGNGTATLFFDAGLPQALIDSNSAILDGINVGSAYYVWDGLSYPSVVAPRVRSSSSSLDPIIWARPMGLSPVIGGVTTYNSITLNAPAATVNTSQTAGWSIALQGTVTTGFYWFIITEIYAPGGDVSGAEKDPLLAPYIVESAYVASDSYAADPNTTRGRPITTTNFTSHTPAGLQLSALATSTITVVLPPPVNNGVDGRKSTNWGIYMAGPTTSADIRPGLATFRRVATPSINVISYTLSNSMVVQPLTYASTYIGGAQFPTFENPLSALGPADNYFAKAATGGAIQAAVYGFNFVNPSTYTGKAVIGIELYVLAGGSDEGLARNSVYIYNTATGKSTPEFIYPRLYFAPTMLKIGGPTDTLSTPWTNTDFDTAANLNVIIIHMTPYPPHVRALRLYSLGITVYYAGSSLNYDGPAYRVVTYTSQVGVTTSDPANMPPPICTTGDLFQGSIVMNDSADKAVLRYSLAGSPEAFPTPYVLKPNSKKRDIITYIRTLGQILIVGYRDSIKRVNYLPRETDTDFQNGIAHDDVTTDHGIAGPSAAVKFDMPGGGVYLFYVSSAGIFMTDGITTKPANTDLDWKNTVKLSALNTCIVHVYPPDKLIAVYYCPAGAAHNKNTKCLYFSYATDKIKNGLFPAVGPITVSGRAVCEANLNGVPLLLTANEEDNTIYVEDQGTTLPATYAVRSLDDLSSPVVVNSPLIRSRKMFVAGPERLAREEKVLILFTANPSTYPTLTISSVPIVLGSNVIDAVSGAKFTNAKKGMRVVADGLLPGTIIIEVTTVNKIKISQNALASQTVDLVLDTGTIAFTVRGSNMNEDIQTLKTMYKSTLVGDLTSTLPDNAKQGLEFQIEKVVLPDMTTVDLGVPMRLHFMVLMVNDLGVEQTRSQG